MVNSIRNILLILFFIAALPVKGSFYTHNDHLGSASWITDDGTKPVQYLHYLPYGQLLANQQLHSYDERFKFIGKERDVESGYDFFGARSYCSPFKHWLSPDPLPDKDPGISSYAYCRWNPIRLVDPDGQEWLTEEDAKQAAVYIEKMKEKMTKSLRTLQKYSSREQNNDIITKRGELQTQIQNLKAGIIELQQMGETADQYFTYHSSPNSSSGYTEIDDETGIIVMTVPRNNYALGVHESSHGYDFWKGEGVTMKGEIKAYKRQYSFDPHSLPESIIQRKKIDQFNMITPLYIKGIYDSNGQLPYRNLK